MLVIRRMKPLGFTLAEMKQLLSAVDVLDDVSTRPGRSGSQTAGGSRRPSRSFIAGRGVQAARPRSRLRRSWPRRSGRRLGRSRQPNLSR
ncbi:hypothetical protein IU438_23605 [Nocardia cyriacigeorgica]|nr:hypothetical protein [Nocardia cyriacigeorgica]MBF6318398.1 hypothetical protein [Nocardia cyriacigeorgica]MBF6398773.1 hypothetical protein [Nocardia cyriacigeorgica]MBF6403713.1 hypothetical protein [Nocardia cyriacigeorgica]MBF6533934.1 hypothetical protein [Nocardia cyriacigeorgica]